jgi:segregation and condensation protein B
VTYSRTEGILEALLFAAGTPAELELLARAVGIDAATCAAVLDNLRAKYCGEDRGIELLRLGDCYQLCTKAVYAEEVRAALEKRRDTALSAAAFEVLAITAYNQPVTRAFIEQARGVDSSGIVSTLVEKGYLEEKGRLDAPGRPMQFGTTASFLRTFGLATLDDLPPIEGELSLFSVPSGEPAAMQGG